MLAEWFVVVEGRETGPFTGAQLKEFAAQGQITPTTSVRQVRMPHAAPAAEIEGLFSIQISKSAPGAPQYSSEDSDPLAFWGLTAVAGISLVLVGYFGWNWLSPKKSTGDEVAAEESVSEDVVPAIPQPVGRRPVWSEEEEEEGMSPEEQQAAIELRQQELQYQEWMLRQQAAQLKANQAKAKTEEEEDREKLDEEQKRKADLEAQRQRHQQIALAGATFTTNYQACWKRMQALAKSREVALLEPFVGVLNDAKAIVRSEKGRKLEHKISELQEKLKRLEKLRKAQEDQCAALDREIKDFLNAASRQAKKDDGYAPFAELWKTMYETNRTAKKVYAEIEKPLRQCMSADPGNPIVIDYRDLVKEKARFKKEQDKLGLTVDDLEELVRDAVDNCKPPDDASGKTP